MLIEKIKATFGRKATTAEIIAILQTVLALGMRCSVHYPQVLEVIRRDIPSDHFLLVLLEDWGRMIGERIERVAALIEDLGGRPGWMLECNDADMTPQRYFTTEIARVDAAIQRCQHALNLSASPSVCDRLTDVVAQFQEARLRLIGIHQRVEERLREA